MVQRSLLLCQSHGYLFLATQHAAPSGVVDLDDGILPAGATRAQVVAGEEIGEAAAEQLVAEQQASPATKEQAIPTEAPAPTDTAEPTNTAVPADTATAAPTRTARPTATIAPTNTVQPTEPPPAGAVVAAVPAGEEAVVTRIIDGDTIEVAINGQSYRVRYIGMDTPEQGMAYYRESTEANRELVEGQTVILVKDVSETDRYGRLLRYVYLTNGVFINAELVRQGFAQVATYPPDVAHQAAFLALQQTARESGEGLWGTVSVAPPTWTPAPLPTWTPAPAAVWTPLPIAPPPPPPSEPPTAEPPPPAAVCDCSGNIYNCGNFSTHNAAQACFGYCWQTVGSDVHRLDGDSDGLACEDLP